MRSRGEDKSAPVATYRLQLHAGFGLDRAADIAPYLSALGISHVYTSPYLQAVVGSMHGYDVVDHSKVNEELGGESSHERFCRVLGNEGLGQLLDIVPNHMAIGSRHNAWWWDVLENGAASRYASYFDIDWEAPGRALEGVLAPVLGDHYGRVLEAGEIQLARHRQRFVLRYFDHEFPVAPRSLAPVLRRAAARAGSDELAFLADSLDSLPPSSETDRASVERRHRDKEVLIALLARLCVRDEAVRHALDATVADINADYDQLDRLHQAQNYRLTYWRLAEDVLAHRRFFDITTLAGLRVEDPLVFDEVHARVLEWLQAGVIDGFRIDHVDGLRDPTEYMQRIRSRAGDDAWILVEKILGHREALPREWPIDGTTGYELCTVGTGLFIDRAAETQFTELYREVEDRESISFEELARAKKTYVLEHVLSAEVHRLAAVFARVCEQHRRHRDYTHRELQNAIRAVASCFPNYRSYVRSSHPVPRPEDVAQIEVAVRGAREHFPEVPGDLLGFFGSILKRELRGELEDELMLRFQQLSAPAMAKGVEDTSFYIYHRFIALNEVGGEPAQFGVAPDEAHSIFESMQRDWPRTMFTTSTHDTKRSEDLRARLAVLSEIPTRWAERVRAWFELGAKHRAELVDSPTAYLLFQTLVGAWPISLDRVAQYLEKACREAKLYTSWTRPDEAYESAIRDYAAGVLSDRELCQSIDEFVSEIRDAGYRVSLAQTLIKLCAAGVPDIYQGCELWDFSLVDPDNRRPVDYETRQALIARDVDAETAWRERESGLPKLFMIRRALAARRTHLDSFGAKGSYTRLAARGECSERLFGFLRGQDMAIWVPRLASTRMWEWGDTTIEIGEGTWRCAFSEQAFRGSVRVEELFARFPVALLIRG